MDEDDLDCTYTLLPRAARFVALLDKDNANVISRKESENRALKAEAEVARLTEEFRRNSG